eukprot:GFUD01016764.1.p1 GENE.GFUD01016764.1~~GFUD01016764.1.p1  ORF type:complete len:195 (+),score=46.59 GFUD01016764.1:204-788(+)
MFSNLFPRSGSMFSSSSDSSDPVMAETDKLAHFAVFHALDSSRSSFFKTSQTEVCLQKCVEKMLERHSMVFGGMMVRLNIDREVNFREGFSEVAEELFRDAVSWSKIVALFAFGARLGQHCRQKGMGDLVEEVASSLASFARERITPFVREEGGWSRLCSVFPIEEDYESQVWQGLVLVGVGLTLATLVMVGRR